MFDPKTGELLTRRHFMGAGLVGLSAFLSAPAVQAAALPMPGVGSFKIAFRHQHTGETFKGTYRVGDRYLPDAFEDINYILRDFRTNEAFPVDPRIVDILYHLHRHADVSNPFEILSGYRSPKTNKMLSRLSEGVAKNSLHMTGQAVDIRLPGFSTWNLRKIATNLKAGGVGYYKNSNFVHIDTGRYRVW